MKKFISGLIIGSILSFSTVTFANNPINLIINGKTIDCGNTPPIIFNNRTYVPARFVAEPLGAKVSWDSINNAVIIIGGLQNGTPTDLPSSTQQPQLTLQQQDLSQQTEYFTGRSILEALGKKYPNTTIYGFGPPIENGINFKGQIYQLPFIIKNNFKYYSIQPLIKAGIISENEIVELKE